MARELRILEDEACGRVQSRQVPADDQAEGVLIAPTRPFDATYLVLATPSDWSAARVPHSSILACVLPRIVPWE